MARDYWIDSTDPPFPAIRHKSHRNFDERWDELLTLTAARQQIKDTCRENRKHWLSVMENQLGQTAEEIQQDG